MSTSTVSPETAIPQHFTACDAEAIGRYVLFLRAMNGRDMAFTLRDLTAGAEEHRSFCRCFQMQLDHINADLTVARKAQKAGRDKTAEIAALVVARDALRQAVAR